MLLGWGLGWNGSGDKHCEVAKYPGGLAYNRKGKGKEGAFGRDGMHFMVFTKRIGWV